MHVVLLAVEVVRTQRAEPSLLRPATGLVGLILLEISLGAATWITKYGWPTWLGDYEWAAGYTVLEGSLPQAMTATAHVAIGSVILATSLVVAMRSVRLARRTPRAAVAGGTWLMEAAR